MEAGPLFCPFSGLSWGLQVSMRRPAAGINACPALPTTMDTFSGSHRPLALGPPGSWPVSPHSHWHLHFQMVPLPHMMYIFKERLLTRKWGGSGLMVVTEVGLQLPRSTRPNAQLGRQLG